MSDSKLGKELGHKTRQAHNLLQKLKSKKEKEKIQRSPNVVTVSRAESFKTCINEDGPLAQLYFKIFSEHMGDSNQAVGQLQTCFHNLRRELDKINADKKLLKNQLEIQKKEKIAFADLYQQEKNKEKDNSILNMSLNNPNFSMDFIENYEQKIDKLAEDLLNKEKEIAGLWDNHRSLKLQIQSKDQKLRVLNRKYQQSQQEKESLIQTVEKLLEQTSSKERDKESQQLMQRRVKQQLKEQEQRLNQEKQQLRNQLQQRIQKIQRQQSQKLKNLQRQHIQSQDRLRRDLQKLYERKQAELKTEFKKQRQVLTNDISQKSNLIQEQKKQIENIRSKEITKIKEDQQSENLLINSNKEKDIKIEKLTMQLVVLTDNNQKLAIKFANIEEELAKQQAQNSSLQQQINRQGIQKHEELQNLKEKHEEEIAKVKGETNTKLANLQKQFRGKLQEQSTRNHDEFQRVSQTNIKLSKQLKQVKEEHEQDKQLLDTVQKQLQALVEQISNKQEVIQQLEHRLQLTKQQNIEIINKNSQYKQELQGKAQEPTVASEEKDQKIQQLLTQNTKIINKLKQQQSENNANKQVISKLERENQQYLTKIRKLEETKENGKMKLEESQGQDVEKLRESHQELLDIKQALENKIIEKDENLVKYQRSIAEYQQQFERMNKHDDVQSKIELNLQLQEKDKILERLTQEKQKEKNKYIKTIEQLTKQLHEACLKANDKQQKNSPRRNSRQKSLNSSRPRSVNKIKSYFGFGGNQ